MNIIMVFPTFSSLVLMEIAVPGLILLHYPGKFRVYSQIHCEDCHLIFIL
jgi:hypothetical protein